MDYFKLVKDRYPTILRDIFWLEDPVILTTVLVYSFIVNFEANGFIGYLEADGRIEKLKAAFRTIGNEKWISLIDNVSDCFKVPIPEDPEAQSEFLCSMLGDSDFNECIESSENILYGEINSLFSTFEEYIANNIALILSVPEHIDTIHANTPGADLQREAGTIYRILRGKFGNLPDWVEVTLNSATDEQLLDWVNKVLDVRSLSELFTVATPAAQPDSPLESTIHTTVKPMKEVVKFLSALQDIESDDDVVEENHISLAEPETLADVTDLSAKLSVPCPDDLKELFTTSGAFYSDHFSAVWNTILIYPCKKLRARSCGLVDFIDEEWGGRPELSEMLSNEEIKSLNSNFVVFGYRYVDDNVHDYFYFDGAGLFHHFYFNQDYANRNIKSLKALLSMPPKGVSLDCLIQSQLSEILAELNN